MSSHKSKRTGGLRSYADYLAILENAGGYCTDPVGKCLRERFAVDGDPKKDIQYCIRDSDTLAACLRGDSLSAIFRQDRAQGGWLIWIEEFSSHRLIYPHEVSVDWESGVFREVGTSGYGCISDVHHCLYAQPKRDALLRSESKPAESAPHPDAETDIAALFDELQREESTTREALIQARRGQGRYRSDLMFLWAERCAVTKCTAAPLLRASHIKPWRDCASHAERLDRYNGLLLNPNHDAAFDRGLISFDDEGRLLLSPKLSASDANLLGIASSQRLVCVFAENRPYLAFHRQLRGF